MPANTPDLPEPEPLLSQDDRQRGDARNGIALAALVLGILSVCTCFPVFGLIAVLLGIIGLIRARALPNQVGRGKAIAGICCAGVSFVLAPMIVNARSISIRAVCASNLRGLGQGLKLYAVDNAGWYPVAPFKAGSALVNDEMAVSFVGQMGANLTNPIAPADEANVHPSRSMFLLVTDDTCTAKQFICPTSDDGEDSLSDTVGGNVRNCELGVDRFDFRGYPHVSYGYQLPFGPHARPSEKLAASVAIMADKGPFFEAGAPTAAGTVPDRAVAATPPGTPIALAGRTCAEDILSARARVWRPFNSRNHDGAGQNVLFQDGHVAWYSTPIVGANHDNIYTRQAGHTLEETLLGKSPEDLRGPLTETDSVIVP